MKERPILFSGEMVRAILDGRKTQTRRIVKHQPDERQRNIILSRHVLKEYLKEKGLWQLVKETSCPYGKPQDQLWVRENFKVIAFDEGAPAQFSPDDFEEAFAVIEYQDGQQQRVEGLVYNQCTDAGEVDEISQASRAFQKKSVPSIHMPRWASRIELLIKDIRVERLQDISEEDAKAEGVYNLGTKRKPEYCIEIAPFTGFRSSKAVECFRELWTSINGPESWDANPWVWVVDFERIQPDSKQEAA